jgi:Na+/H+-dicarboxylate symporter/ABC-type amino acid transport substrate-binding protein
VADDQPAPASPRRRSLSIRILIGLGLGVALGLFLGDRVSFLDVAADAYVKLLQMTVLPFVTGSLIAGLGTLRWEDVQSLGLRIAAILALLWGIGLVAAFLFPLVFPTHQTASFFSTTLLERPAPFDLVNLYIPTNPFYSLANTIMPAVVLFSVLVGLALITVRNKSRLLDVIQVANAALSNATAFIVSLTPYGVFAIGAVAAGTLTLEDLSRLQVYVVSYVAIALLLSLWVLPGLIAVLTPIPYRAVMARTRDALITAFMTSSLFAVLPLLMEDVSSLMRDHAKGDSQSELLPSVIVPASFTFPHVGKVLSLSFVLFAAWFTGTSLAAFEYPKLAATGIAVMFGNINLAIPFLLDLFRIPADTFQLFVATSVVNARFGTLMSVSHTLAISVLGTCAVTGRLRVDRARLLAFAAVTGVLTIALVGGLRTLFTLSPDHEYDKDKVLAGMNLLRRYGTARVFTSTEPAPPLAKPGGSVLERLRTRGTLRVGYLDDSLPYVFFNTRRDIVGLDVEMAHLLASDLGVTLEFTPVPRTILTAGLDPSTCDLVMSGTVVTAERSLQVLFSAPYLDETIAFLVLDHRRGDFLQWDQIQAMPNLRVGVPREPFFMRKAQSELPAAQIVPLDRIEDMFVPHDPPIDAFIMTAERGSAYTLLHPEYSVAVPQTRQAKIPLAYVIAGRDQELADLVNTWIEVKRKDGSIEELFAHWILGHNASPRQPRWSIAHDVLHWL